MKINFNKALIGVFTDILRNEIYNELESTLQMKGVSFHDTTWSEPFHGTTRSIECFPLCFDAIFGTKDSISEAAESAFEIVSGDWYDTFDALERLLKAEKEKEDTP